MRVLVTGAAGFIGKTLCPLLQELGHVIIGVDAFVPEVHGDTHEWPAAVDERQRHPCSVARFVRKDIGMVPDAIVHLAARVGVGQSQYRIAHYVEENVAQTATLLEWAADRRIRTVIVASSMSTYGEGQYLNLSAPLRRMDARGYDAFDMLHDDGQWHPCGDVIPVPTRESHPQRPVSVYGQTKLDQEHYARIVGAAYGTRVVALRLWNVYGAGQALHNPYTGVLAGFAGRLLNGHAPLLFEDGGQTRDFIHVSDVARAICLALENYLLHGAYNICTGQATSIRTLAECWLAMARERGLISGEMAPIVDGRVRAGDVRHCVGSPDAFAARTGWTPRVSLANGLRMVAEWVWQGPRDVSHCTDAAVTELLEHGLLR